MYKPQKEHERRCPKTLQAIQEFTELGSGYKIAQRDLMIRGAGDIFGAEQAGFIDTVGLDLYMKLLNEAIEEKKTGFLPRAEAEQAFQYRCLHSERLRGQ
jgi:transcription-repair coupling factor (superfamily II helicase)